MARRPLPALACRGTGATIAVRALTALPIVLLTGSAWAEVCDKVRPHWNPSTGPADRLEELVLAAASWPWWVCVVVVLMAIWSGNRWMRAVAALLLFGYAALLWIGWMAEDEITQDAIAEGCVASPIYPVVLLVALGAVMAIRAAYAPSRSLL